MTDRATELLDWYDSNRRRLPWRAEPGRASDPYAVWLSEVMLQQTTVATVKDYFARFMALWPTVDALAAAPLDDVLKEWAGLGYYARARNLHKCANAVVTDHGGRFPDNEAGLRALPGVGDYTAAAIAAIAFGEAAAVVDGNVERVISRLNRLEEELPGAKKSIKALTAAITPTKRPGDFAQAMMDLGATVCTPKKPKCLLCPWVKACAARAAGDAERFPMKAPKKEKPTRRTVAFWLIHDGHVLLERRAPKGLLGGMPGLFSTPWTERADFPAKPEWLDHKPSDDYWKPVDGTAKHTFTHFHLETRLVAAKASQRYNIENGFWHPLEALQDVGLPTVFKKMASLAAKG
ncbi:A/G-specific adenine glycosylase [Kordiimonas marina]|uniref:A/G-specific adenine glycosylase n=1 Tax=Kordiimonas marina TaxID=2872312 RepID=UPI001FF2B3BD|nr:A/G-specific adenine glycosylase [Kordiimonas marina]MCJ9429405.1 A/G-specific adenine glycosylase [Kordiimonas marina]